MATKNYTINFVDPTKSTLNILPNTQAGPRGGNRQTDIDLMGMGNSLWGEAILENFIHILENFSCTEDIHAIDTVPSTSTFTVLGDVEKSFLSGTTFDISGSDNNDGNYTVISGIYNGSTETTITISAPSLNTGAGNFGLAGEAGVPNKSLDFSPTTPIQGQLWYNQTSGQIHVYDTTGSPVVGIWKPVGGAGTTIVTVSTVAPTSPVTGDLWWEPVGQELSLFYVTWIPVAGNYLLLDGSTAMTGALNMGTNKIEAVADPDSADDAVNLGYADARYVNVTGDTMAGILNMGSFKIEAVADPDSADDAVNLGYADARYVEIAGDTMAGILNMGTNKIEGLADPDTADDAVNRGYADARYVNVTGDTMAGILNMGTNKIEAVADPDSADDAVNLGYADARYVEIAGDTMTSFLTLNADPVNPLHAVTMQYVDGLVAPKTVTFVSKSGHDSIYFLISGKMYSTSGIDGIGNATTGRGLENTIPTSGLNNLQEVRPKSNVAQSAIKQIGGGYHTVGYMLLENGYLWTWGANTKGQCGLGHTTPVATPTLAVAGGVVEVYEHPTNGGHDIDDNRLFIKKDDDFIYGCGYNNYGQLGLADTTDRSTFTQLTSLGTTVTSFWNMGSRYGCFVAQKTDKSIWVAGYNGHGQLGIGTTLATNSTPVDVTTNWVGAGSPLEWTITSVHGGFGYNDTTSDTSDSTLAILLDNTTDTRFSLCGNNLYGQLGDGTIVAKSTPVTPSVGTGRISKAEVFGGGRPTVNVLKEDGELYTWGYNNYGQCGVGNTTDVTTPNNVLSAVSDIFNDGQDADEQGFWSTSYIKKTDGLLYATGHNLEGQLGRGSLTPSNATTYDVVLLPYDSNIKNIGHYTTFRHRRIIVAITADNRVYGWGHNVQLGVINSNLNATTGIDHVLTPMLFDVEGLD